MTTHLDRLKSAEHKLHTLRLHVPTLEAAFNHRLCKTFPRLPQDTQTEGLHINHEALPEPGQSPVLVSKTLSSQIEGSFLAQTPPTFVQGQHHVYSQAYSVDEAHRTPGLPPADLESYLEHVIRNYDLCVQDVWADFWQTPHAEFQAMPPQQWLTQCLQHLLLDEAAVRLEDQTLSRAAADAITHGCSSVLPKHPSTQGLYEVFLKAERPMPDIKLRGVFAITDKHLSDTADSSLRTVVFYTPDNGLEAFDSLHLLTQELNARLKDPEQRAALLNLVLAKEHPHTQGLEQVRLVSTEQEAPSLCAKGLIEKLKHDMLHACAEARRNHLAGTTFVSPQRLFKRIEQSVNASWFVNPAAIVRSRYAHLFEKQLPHWLKTATDDEKAQWRLAAARLIHEQQACEAPDASPITESGKKHTLLGYARTQLKQQIKADHGIECDPDSLCILTTEAVQTGPVIFPTFGSAYTAGNSIGRTGPTLSYVTHRMSLTQLALSNVGVWDVTFALTAQIIEANGTPHPVLTKDYIKTLVRQLDVGDSYIKHLNHVLVTSPQAGWRKERYVALKRAQLSLDLLEAKLAGTLNATQVAIVQAVLDQPDDATRAKVEGAQVRAQLLIVNKNVLPGVMVFSSTASTELLCYLPDAPDNSRFLVANARQALGQLMSREHLHSYVQQRVTSARQPYLTPLLKAGLDESSTQLQIIYDHAFEASYNNEVSYAFRDADEQTTSTYESNVNTAKDAVLAVVDVVSFVLPVRVLLPIVALRFIYQITLGVDALAREEEHEAFLHFMGAIAHVTDGASDFAGSSVFARAIRQRVKPPAATLSPGAACAKPGSDLLLKTGGAYGGGVYESVASATGPTRHYIKDETGNVYRARYDTLENTWRVIDERNPNAPYQTPVREISAGRWGVNVVAPFFQRKSAPVRLVESARVTGVNLSAHTADSQGIYHLNNKRYIQENGHVYEVYKGWLGRNVYVQTPGGSAQRAGPYKLRKTAEHWEIKLGPNGWRSLRNPDIELPAALPVVPEGHYDVPAQYNKALQLHIENTPKFLDSHYIFPNPEIARLAKFFTEFRLKLLADAQHFFASNPIKPRPARPTLPAPMAPQDFFKRLHEDFNGIVVGECHSDIGAKKILIESMKSLSKNKVKVIYLEHLQTDAHQPLLDKYFKTGKMDRPLKQFLKNQDAGHQLPEGTPYTYSNLVREARRYGIEIKALDCMASYYSQDLPITAFNLERYEMFSYVASRVIQKHMADTGGHKWIALTGNSHTNTFKGVPGLSELEGAVGIRVTDAACGTPYTLRQDISDLIKNRPGADYTWLKNDYWLEVNIEGAQPGRPPLSVEQLEHQLDKPGTFLLDNSPQGARLIHRSTSNEIVYTPLKTTESGHFFIERPRWQPVHEKRYVFVKHLIDDLHAIGLRHAP